MQVPNVLALPLEEALKRLAEAGVEYEIKERTFLTTSGIR